MATSKAVQEDPILGHNDDFRRTWDKATYEKLAKERLKKETKGEEKSNDPPVKRENLKARDYRVDLDSKLGKTLVVTKATPQSLSGGYYCNVCDCVVKDSINFLDHINGRKHQRNMGMSMRVERSTLDQVKKRFEFNKKKKEEEKKKYDFEERMKELKEEYEKPHSLAAYKQPGNDYELDAIRSVHKIREEKLKEYRREKRKERKRTRTEEEEEEVDPELAAMMGFGGFGAKRKA